MKTAVQPCGAMPSGGKACVWVASWTSCISHRTAFLYPSTADTQASQTSVFGRLLLEDEWSKHVISKTTAHSIFANDNIGAFKQKLEFQNIRPTTVTLMASQYSGSCLMKSVVMLTNVTFLNTSWWNVQHPDLCDKYFLFDQCTLLKKIMHG